MLAQLFSEMPFASWSSVAFYAVVALMFIPAARSRVFPLFVSPTPSTHIHLAPLDVLRGLFALWVAMFHYVGFANGRFGAVTDSFRVVLLGNLGVPCFTVLSGMLIYMSVKKLSTLEDLSKYTKRRFLRIYPLYIVASIASMLWCVMDVKLRLVTSEFLMLHAIGFRKFANPPSWSLHVEVLYYIIIPFLVVTFRKSMRTVSVVAILALLTIEGFGNTAQGGPEIALWRYFFVGILCAEYLDTWLAMPRRYGVLSLLVGLLLMSACVYSYLHTEYLGNREKDLAMLVGIPLIILGSCASYKLFENPVCRAFGFLGTISYSIYMLHMLILRADLRFVWNGLQPDFVFELPPAVEVSYPAWTFYFIILPAIIFWSSLSYACIERPFLLMRPRSTPQ